MPSNPVAPFGHSRPSTKHALARALGRARGLAKRATEKAAKHLSDPPSTLDALFAMQWCSGRGDSAAGRAESLVRPITLCATSVPRHQSPVTRQVRLPTTRLPGDGKYTANTSIWFADIGASALSVPRVRPGWRVAVLSRRAGSIFCRPSLIHVHHTTSPLHGMVSPFFLFFSPSGPFLDDDGYGPSWADRPLDSLTNRVASCRFLPLCLSLCARAEVGDRPTTTAPPPTSTWEAPLLRARIPPRLHRLHHHHHHLGPC